jgi:hydrogenase nickel incorporation protein HypA/HybF
MHELSIALNLVEIAESAAREQNATHVEVVHLRLGVFSGVMPESLQFAYDVVTQGTMLAGSRLIIEALPLVIYCSQCHMERQLDTIQSLECPVCGTASNEIRQGQEIELAYLEVLDATETA